MKLQDIFEAIVDLEDDAEDLTRKPFVPTTKFHRAMDTNQKRRVGTDRGSAAIEKDTPREVKQAAAFLRDILIGAFSGRKRTTFNPITYEDRWIRIKVAWDSNIHQSEQQLDDLNALAEYLGSEGGVKPSRDELHKYVTVKPFNLLQWVDAEFPTTAAEIAGAADRAYDPYAPKPSRKDRWQELTTNPKTVPEEPTRKIRRITKDDQRQEKIDAAKRSRDSQLAWEFERTRKEREKAARTAELKAELQAANSEEQGPKRTNFLRSRVKR